jgi:DNA-binding MarR family transcriptional regulator
MNTPHELTGEELLDCTIESFWETVPQVWNKIRGHIRQTAVSEFGITVDQFHLLRFMRRGMDSASELAVEKGISRSAISQALETLVEKGLVSRQQRRDDRRCVDLALTPAGDELLDAIFALNTRWLRQKMGGLSSSEMGELIRSMDVLKRTFEEA